MVLVHGAFADAPAWAGAVLKLQAAGYRVIAPANPLRALASDVDYLEALLAPVTGRWRRHAVFPAPMASAMPTSRRTTPASPAKAL